MAKNLAHFHGSKDYEGLGVDAIKVLVLYRKHSGEMVHRCKQKLRAGVFSIQRLEGSWSGTRRLWALNGYRLCRVVDKKAGEWIFCWAIGLGRQEAIGMARR